MIAPRGHLSPPEVTNLDQADDTCGGATKMKPARILVVDGAHALDETHLLLLGSIPAIVERLICCADMYLHKELDYALVILVLHSQSNETAEAASFIRTRWSRAKILLLEGECPRIDDWLYDERIDPYLHPKMVLEAAIRLMNDVRY